ncbi:hypothetical protein Glove_109g237 [Diversispora epigaea]|uniref:Uncharacterized protein n=1 Tax=Diversispora epigaea TaxID=1348612 RepID=A0A397J255_9GLOM|nr:hypothetical protein Glove_109g237 [Diversispora epigaea]
MKDQKMQQTPNDEIDPNDPFGIGLVPYHPNLITFTYTGKENLLLDFEEPDEIPVSKNEYVTKCCFHNKSDSDDDSDNESFFEYLSDDGVEFYECYNCKRKKYEDKKRGRGEEVKRKRRN